MTPCNGERIFRHCIKPKRNPEREAIDNRTQVVARAEKSFNVSESVGAIDVREISQETALAVAHSRPPRNARILGPFDPNIITVGLFLPDGPGARLRLTLIRPRRRHNTRRRAGVNHAGRPLDIAKGASNGPNPFAPGHLRPAPGSQRRPFAMISLTLSVQDFEGNPLSKLAKRDRAGIRLDAAPFERE